MWTMLAFTISHAFHFHSIFSSWLLRIVPLVFYMIFQRADSSIWIDLGAMLEQDFRSILRFSIFFLPHFWTDKAFRIFFRNIYYYYYLGQHLTTLQPDTHMKGMSAPKRILRFHFSFFKILSRSIETSRQRVKWTGFSWVLSMSARVRCVCVVDWPYHDCRTG